MGTEKGQNGKVDIVSMFWLAKAFFRGNIRQIRCPSKQRVCAIVGTQALGAQTCSY